MLKWSNPIQQSTLLSFYLRHDLNFATRNPIEFRFAICKNLKEPAGSIQFTLWGGLLKGSYDLISICEGTFWIRLMLLPSFMQKFSFDALRAFSYFVQTLSSFHTSFKARSLFSESAKKCAKILPLLRFAKRQKLLLQERTRSEGREIFAQKDRHSHLILQTAVRCAKSGLAKETVWTKWARL